MTLFSTGNFLVGTGSDNGARLQVSGTATIGTTSNGGNVNAFVSSYGNNGLFQSFGTDGALKLQMGGLGTNEAFFYTGPSNKLTFYSGGAVALTLASTGAATFISSVTAGSSSATNYGTLQIMGGVTSASLTVGTAANTVLAFSAGQELAITGNNAAPYGISFQGRNSLAGGGASGTAYPIILNPLGGNVGIGTESPAAKLDIIGPSAASSPYLSKAIQFAPSNFPTRTWSLNYDDGGTLGNGFNISAGSTRILYLNANGNVGIGTASPSTLFNVSGYQSANWITTINNTGTSGHNLYFGYNNGTSTTYGLYINGGRGAANQLDFAVENKFYVNGNGNVLIGTTTDAGFKLNINSSTTGLNVGNQNNSVKALATFNKTLTTGFGTANNYLQLGAGENGLNGTRLIGFGYSITANTNQPAYIGYIETLNVGETKWKFNIWDKRCNY
jgi:hypothetical protein